MTAGSAPMLPSVPLPLPAFAPASVDIGSLGGWAIVVAAVIATLVLRPRAGAEPPSGLRARRAGLAIATVLLLLSAVLPVAARFGDGLTWAAVLRGHAAEPSVVLVVAALWRLAGRLGGHAAGPSTSPAAMAAAVDRRVLLALAVAVGWTLILTQLNTDRVDLYRWGYLGTPVAVAAAAVALLAAATGLARTATALAAALAAWGLGLVESTNLWDALADPWLTLAATVWWIGQARRAPWRRRRRPDPG